jgi:hypothetical protein
MNARAAQAALARIEGARLLRSPLVWLSFVPLVLWARATDPGPDPEDVHFLLVGYGLAVPGFVFFALVVAAALRGRMAGTDELLDALPLGRDRRSLGHALSILGAGGAGAAAIGAAYVALRPEPVVGTMHDVFPPLVEVPRPGLAQLLQGPLAVVVFCALGLAMVRWLPHWSVIVAMILPALMQYTWFGIWNGTPVSGVRWLVPVANGMIAGNWRGCGSDDAFCDLELAGFDRVTPWWHVGYLVALALSLVAVAVLRDRRDRRTWAALGTSLALVVALGLVQAAVYEPYAAPAGA